MGRRIQICFDCANAEHLASFWAEALAYDMAEPPTGFDTWAGFSAAESESGERWCQIIDPDGRGPMVLFHTVPESKEVKNRLHLDVFASDGDIEAAITRLRVLGATHLRTDHDGGFAVMQDPEGNEFCVA